MTDQPWVRGRLRWVALLGALVSTWIGARVVADALRDDILVSHENTWRDLTVYAEVARGRIPLQGPPTSVGGHHGPVGSWIYGAFSALLPGWTALQAFGVVLLLGTAAASWTLAAQLASRRAATAGTAVYLASTLLFLPTFPNHIDFLPLGAVLTFLGLVRWRAVGAPWDVVCAAGVALELGVHRMGWLLLLGVVVCDRVYRLGVFRRVWPWAVAALTLVPPTLGACWGSGYRHGGGDMLDAIERLRPLLVARKLPLVGFREVGVELWEWCSLGVVLLAWGLAWASRRDPDARMVLGAYGLCTVSLLLYKFDAHYYLPPFALLPAVVAMGLDADGPRTWIGAEVLGVALAALLATNPMLELSGQLRAPETTPFRETDDELQVVAALDRLGVGEEELLARVHFVGRSPDRHLDHLFALFSSDPERAGREDRCVTIEPDDGAAEGEVVDRVGAYRVVVTPRTGACPSDVRRSGPPIWYLDLRGGFVQR